MGKLLYSATRADGSSAEGFVDADSARAARDALLAQGLHDVVLHQEPALPTDEAQLKGLSARQQQALARLHLSARRSPTLMPVLAEVARRSWFWLMVDAALVALGVWHSEALWIGCGLVGAALPFALTAWTWRHAGRYKRLVETFSVGDWSAARALVEQLRPISLDKPQIAFDLDVRKAYIDARQHALGRAVGGFLALAAQPAVWTALAFAAVDHAFALVRAGRRDEARDSVCRVWPIVRAHAQASVLTMLEAEGLAPT